MSGAGRGPRFPFRAASWRPFWPGGLAGRVTAVLLAALLLEFVGSALVFEQAETAGADQARLVRTASQLAAAARLLDTLPDEARARVALLLSTEPLRLRWLPPDMPTPPEPATLHGLHRRLRRLLPPSDAASLSLDGALRGDVGGRLLLRDGSVLHFTAPALVLRRTLSRGILSGGLLAACVLLVAVLLVRSASLPLKALSRAADAIGRGPAVPVREHGPREVRDLARAMNAMQGRIEQLLRDRTEALAAVSHDLRTPLSRLRLRAGFLDDRDAQRAVEADLDDMDAMLNSVLSFLAGEDDAEPRRPIDLAALLVTLVDAASDGGRDARYGGPDHAVLRLRPLATKRVFTNLVGNALTHAGNVAVTLQQAPDGGVVVLVEDDGPGIPDGDLSRVLTPFVRVEGSRSRATGGVGLGLAIVRREVLRDGGQVALCNRPGGGLRVRIAYQDRPRSGAAAGP